MVRLAPGIFAGKVRHRRHTSPKHQFSYNVKMLLLDLDDIDGALQKVRFLSRQRMSLLGFDESRYLPDTSGRSLKEKVLSRVKEKIILDGDERVYMLTQPRSLGVHFNPVTFYVVYKQDGNFTFLLEVTNTPWLERHTYVLVDPMTTKNIHQYHFKKMFHISPFMGMDYHYKLSTKLEEEEIFVHMESWKEDAKRFDATLSLQKKVCFSELNGKKVFFPLMTLKVVFGIYWQALLLFIKRCPFHSHPNRK